MSSKECEEQLKRLIYDWETEGLLTKINATDIEAIKHLMLENQILQGHRTLLKEEIKAYQTLYFDKVMIINEAIEYIENRAKKAGVKLMPREIELLEILKKDNKED